MPLKEDSLFKLPRQDLPELSLFKPHALDVAAWVEHLPKTDLGETSKLLFKAIAELNHYKLYPNLRLDLLEILRPAIHFATAELSKHYLNQPIIMSEKAQKIANISHALSDQLATGYILAALHADGTTRNEDGDSLIATSLHRAINELGEIILLHTQLYRDPPPGIWLKLHQMMLLAQQNCVDQQNVLDTLVNESTTVSAAYLRVALVGAARPFQLRQQDMSIIAKALRFWSPLARLMDWPTDGVPILGVNPAEDMPPRLGGLLKNRPGQCFSLYTDELVAELRRLYQEAAPGALALKIDHLLLSVDLIKHLIHAWSEISTRNFMRLEAHESVDLCLGLSATHHFLADGADLDTIVEGAQLLSMEASNRFLEEAASKTARRKDIWDSPYESNFGQVNVTLATLNIRNSAEAKPATIIEEKFTTYQVDTINFSPSGYCVKWSGDEQAPIRAGDIVGIREHRNMKWSIGVIRWAKNEAGNTQIGLELISPSAYPYGARPIQKSGEQGEFLRALLLPELKALGQPASLVTANVPFKSQQKVVLRQNGKETIVQLGRRIAGNSVYSQFAFRQFGDHQADDDPDTIDKLWSSL